MGSVSCDEGRRMADDVYDVLDKLDVETALAIWTKVENGDTVQAIKRLAKATGLSLKQARALVLSLSRDEHRKGSGIPDPNDANNIGYWR